MASPFAFRTISETRPEASSTRSTLTPVLACNVYCTELWLPLASVTLRMRPVARS
jgi:hypothetical protein